MNKEDKPTRSDLMNPNNKHYVGDAKAREMRMKALHKKIKYGKNHQNISQVHDERSIKNGDFHTYGYSDEYWQD